MIAPAGRMHADELETDEGLVRRLLDSAMPRPRAHLHTYPAIVQEAWRWLGEALADS